LRTVFDLTPPAAGGTGTGRVLYSFTGENGDGSIPVAGLSIGNYGAPYGTTVWGGAAEMGTVFELTPPAAPGGPWIETVLYSFTGQNGDGYNPYTGVLIGADGALYGTTEGGGIVTSACPSSCGTVFVLTRPDSPGGAWKETVLHRFTGQHGNGANPRAALVMSGSGAFYGTTLRGGSGSCSDNGGTGCGTVFELSPPPSPGNAWTQNALYSFTDQDGDGAAPNAGVAVGGSGAIVDAISNGGSAPCVNFSPNTPPGCGTVFELTPPPGRGGNLDGDHTLQLFGPIGNGWILGQRR
jgi:hypothetical protein